MPALMILNHLNHGRTILYLEQMHPVFTTSSTRLLKVMALRQETRAVPVCENQQIRSHQFGEHLKQCCTQNLENYMDACR